MADNKVVSIDSGHHREKLLAERDALVLEHLPLVDSIARRIANSLPPSFDVEDLIGVGNVALLRVALRYKPAQHNGTPFWAYARQSIRGAMLESVRRNKYVEATRPPISEMEAQLADPAAADAPDRAVEAKETAARIAEALSWLAPAERAVIREYYGAKEPTVEDVAVRLGMSIRKTRDAHRAGIAQLRARLKKRA